MQNVKVLHPSYVSRVHRICPKINPKCLTIYIICDLFLQYALFRIFIVSTYVAWLSRVHLALRSLSAPMQLKIACEDRNMEVVIDFVIVSKGVTSQAAILINNQE